MFDQPSVYTELFTGSVFLTRLLFCFYAEDTGIFKESQMSNAIANTTQADGSDLDQFFATLFKVLNTPKDDAYRKTLPAHMADFEYVNGGLFASESFIPKFGKKSRRVILESGSLDWKKINPDIFGSMFQSVVDPKKRGSLGQHYTSVPNIMKVIQPLFLDKLYEELEKSKGNVKKLEALIMRLERIRVFDPACGSGNFLIIAYKELRRFEMEVFKALNEASGQDVMFYSGIRLNQFYGIEIDDFAHEIALLSLWLTEHQMNVEFKEEFGYAEPALPLKDAGNIRQGNSLRIEWEEVCPKSDDAGELEVYICGNPPFLGKQNQNKEQRSEQEQITKGIKSGSDLDYVACWFLVASRFIEQRQDIRAALVATNSITQGEQVSILWNTLFNHGIQIDFAYKTFEWKSAARGKAAVHCVVIGFGAQNDTVKKTLYDSPNKDSQIHSRNVKNINPYLIEASNFVVEKRRTPLLSVPSISYGNKPTDNGKLILNSDEMNLLLRSEPEAKKWIRKYIGSKEFINGLERWCIWLKDASQYDINSLPLIRERVDAVRNFREESSAKPTRKSASTPHLFFYISHPETEYIVIPETSSSRRKYVPFGYVDKKTIASNATYLLAEPNLYIFGILNSLIHNEWLGTVGGRLKSDYRYSGSLVYNTFPWPEVNDDQRKHIESLAKEIILIRQDYELEGQTLADMYDPEKMPKDLLEAHQTLDKAVEKLYRDKPFKDASDRLEFLFARYEELVKAESKS
jgi:hypothetical protein